MGSTNPFIIQNGDFLAKNCYFSLVLSKHVGYSIPLTNINPLLQNPELPLK